MRKCSVDGCPRVHLARGYCKSHYNQWHSGRPITQGEPTDPRRFGHGAKSLEEFFWKRVSQTPNCWEWQGVLNNRGYGVIKFKGKQMSAHRVSVELHHGPINKGQSVDHLCHNPRCVRPEHLRLSSHKENMENRKGAHKNSLSGVRGVTWNSRRKKWRGRVRHNNVIAFERYFDDLDEADKAVAEKRAELYSPIPSPIAVKGRAEALPI